MTREDGKFLQNECRNKLEAPEQLGYQKVLRRFFMIQTIFIYGLFNVQRICCVICTADAHLYCLKQKTA